MKNLNTPNESFVHNKSNCQTPVPLLVFGVSRSGTSYLHDLLKAHPQIHFSYESRTIREGNYYYSSHKNLQDRQEFYKLLEELCKCEEEEPINRWMLYVINEYREELFRRHTINPSFSKLIENIYMLPDPVRCWGTKLLRVEVCPELLHHWPNTKVVILIRDPRAVYSSQYKFYKMRVKYSAIYWNIHSNWTRKHAMNSSQYLVIKYEDFVENPSTELSKILKLAEIYDTDVMEKMLTDHPPFKEGLSKWRKSLDTRDIYKIESICFDEMKFWGYTPEVAHKPKQVGSLTKGLEALLNNAGSIPLDIHWWRRKKLLKRFLALLRS